MNVKVQRLVFRILETTSLELAHGLMSLLKRPLKPMLRRTSTQETPNQSKKHHGDELPKGHRQAHIPPDSHEEAVRTNVFT